VVEGALENQICKGDKEVLKAANESSSLVFCITQLLTHTQQTVKKKREGKKKKSQKRKVVTTTTTLKHHLIFIFSF
jgi:hypothetical protein